MTGGKEELIATYDTIAHEITWSVSRDSLWYYSGESTSVNNNSRLDWQSIVTVHSVISFSFIQIGVTDQRLVYKYWLLRVLWLKLRLPRWSPERSKFPRRSRGKMERSGDRGKWNGPGITEGVGVLTIAWVKIVNICFITFQQTIYHPRTRNVRTRVSDTQMHNWLGSRWVKRRVGTARLVKTSTRQSMHYRHTAAVSLSCDAL